MFDPIFEDMYNS